MGGKVKNGISRHWDFNAQDSESILIRKDGKDSAEAVVNAAVDIGVCLAFPEMTAKEQIAYGVSKSGLGAITSSGENVDRKVKSGGVSTMADMLNVRISVAKPETEEGSLIYDLYPTNETEDRLSFYNKVFSH